jgi:hypothetical protein
MMMKKDNPIQTKTISQSETTQPTPRSREELATEDLDAVVGGLLDGSKIGGNRNKKPPLLPY